MRKAITRRVRGSGGGLSWRRMRHGFFAVVCAGLALALSAGAGAETPATPEAPKPAESAGTLSKEEAAALAAEVAPIVEEIRGAKFAHPVPVEIVDDQAARAHFKSRISEHWPEEARRAEEVVDAHLGLIPPKTDLEEEVFDVLEEQAGGYYDPDRDTFFVLGDMPRAAAPIIVAHELTHALDDQRYGIDRLLAEAEEDDDRSGALEAVVEGSGTVVMTVFIHRQIVAGKLDPKSLLAFQESEVGKAERLKASPLFVQRSLIAPYILGMAFLLRGELIRIQTGGITPSDLDHAFSDPPRSTEQILHPEKYAAREAPVDVSVPGGLTALLGAGWTEAGRDTLGEEYLRVWLGQLGASQQAFAAAAGWGGDRLALFEGPNGATQLVVITFWDTATDADEFASALGVVGAAGKLTLTFAHASGSKTVSIAIGPKASAVLPALPK